MKRALIILALILGSGITNSAEAQSKSELKYRPFRVTLFPGLSTNGVEAPNYSAKYSLNILGGYHGALEGYEIGVININRVYTEGFQLGVFNGSGGHMSGLNFAGLANYAREDMQGVQFAGLGNISEGSIQGLQFAGLVNSGVNGLQGLQFAGIANITGGDIQGIQAAGVANAGKGDIQGIIMSGIGNFSSGYAQGIMMAGILNVANEIQGISMAGILNVGRDLEGIQISGIANIAQRAEGMQIGLVNTAQYFDGVPVGLISLYGNGRKNIDFWINDGGYLNAGLKLGTTDIYNMISLGYNSALNNSELWSFGWTIGSYKPLEEAWNNDRYTGYFRMKDFGIQNLHEGTPDTWTNSLYSFRYLLGKDITNGFGVYAGPSLNLLITDKDEENSFTWYSIFEGERGGKDIRFWVGASVGIQFFGH